MAEIGEIKKFPNGNVARWDGQGWLQIDPSEAETQTPQLQMYGPETPQKFVQPNPIDPIAAAKQEISVGIAKEGTKQALNLGGYVRKIPGVNRLLQSIPFTHDPLQDISRARVRGIIARNPDTGEQVTASLEDKPTLDRSGFNIVGVTKEAKAPEPLSLYNEAGQKAMGLNPEGFWEKAGATGLDIAEYAIPGSNVAKGTKLLSKAPLLAKMGKSGEILSQALPEMASAYGVSKIQQPEESAAGITMIAGITPGVYNKGLKFSGDKLPLAIAEKIPEVQLSPKQMLFKALKPINRNLEFETALERGVPEIYNQAQTMGKKIKNVDDLISVIKEAKKRVWSSYRDLIGNQNPVAKQIGTIDGNRIADQMIASIPGRQAIKNPAEAAKVQAFADSYRRPLSLQEAEDALQNVNAETEAYYNLFPRARHSKAEANMEIGSALAEADALRKEIYANLDMLDEIAGTKGVGGRSLKQTYGALTNIENEAYRRVNVSKRLAPESLIEQMAMLKASGRFAASIIKGNPVEGMVAFAEGMTTRAAGKEIARRNTSDYLVAKAMEDYGKQADKIRKGQRILTGSEAERERLNTPAAAPTIRPSNAQPTAKPPTSSENINTGIGPLQQAVQESKKKENETRPLEKTPLDFGLSGATSISAPPPTFLEKLFSEPTMWQQSLEAANTLKETRNRLEQKFLKASSPEERRQLYDSPEAQEIRNADMEKYAGMAGMTMPIDMKGPISVKKVIGGIYDKAARPEPIQRNLQSNLRAGAPGVGSAAEPTEAGEQLLARRHPDQTILTIEEAENWLNQRGLKPKGTYDIARAVRNLNDNQDFWNLNEFDRGRIYSQLERREEIHPFFKKNTISITSLINQEKKAAEALASAQGKKLNAEDLASNRKLSGSGILPGDTVIGCDNNCPECYCLKTSRKQKVQHQNFKRVRLTGNLEEGYVLRLGTNGDPAKDWKHTAKEVHALIARSRAAGHDVTPARNSYAITKLLDVRGFDPKAVPNLEISLDPLYPAHMTQTMVNALRLKTRFPEVNIVARIRSVAPGSDRIAASMDAAKQFVNDFNIQALETRMRFLREDAFDILGLDRSQYHYERPQYKVNKPLLEGQVKKHALCDVSGTGCPGCKTCRALMTGLARVNNIADFTAALKENGITSGSFRGAPLSLDVRGNTPLVQIETPGKPPTTLLDKVRSLKKPK
jgi:hypothetical protein